MGSIMDEINKRQARIAERHEAEFLNITVQELRAKKAREKEEEFRNDVKKLTRLLEELKKAPEPQKHRLLIDDIQKIVDHLNETLFPKGGEK